MTWPPKDKAEREDAAKIVYAAMQELMPLGQDYPWVEGGNSSAQDEARRAAAKILTLLDAARIGGAEAACLHSHTQIDYYANPPQGYVPRFVCAKCGAVLHALRAQEGA